MASKNTNTATSEMKTKPTDSTGAASKSHGIPRPIRLPLQNFLLIWLDADLNENNEDFKNSINQLKRLVLSIETFTDAQECIDFLSNIENQKVFMIVSGAMGEKTIPKIESWTQLELVYVFCGNRTYHEQWAKKIPKIKGVYTKIEAICESLKIDREQCDRNMIPISFNEIDPLFMYTQLLKEALLQIEDDDKQSIKDLVDYCREQDNLPRDQIEQIAKEYRLHSPVYWYTAPYFIYSMLNRGLREMNVDIILKFGFFIRHLHQHIADLHVKQQESTEKKALSELYRGQGLSSEDFEKLKKTKGGLMTFNNFLSTSSNRDISLNNFARPAAFHNPNNMGILFVMKIDTKSNVPFADVKEESYFKAHEAEILFATHTVFRIDGYKRIDDPEINRLWEVQLSLVGSEDHALQTLTSHIRKELQWTTGWSRLGDILIRLGENEKARHLYDILLSKPCSEEERAHYYNQLGMVYYNMGEYSKALSSYERSLEIRKIALPPNHPDFAQSYNNIGLVHYNMGEYSKALEYLEKARVILEKSLPKEHPHIAMVRRSIELVRKNL